MQYKWTMNMCAWVEKYGFCSHDLQENNKSMCDCVHCSLQLSTSKRFFHFSLIIFLFIISEKSFLMMLFYICWHKHYQECMAI